MVFGIVTIIEGKLGAQIRAVWDEIRAAQGAETLAGMSLPHLSYHVADDYDPAALRRLFERIAARRPPFIVPAAGLGLFYHRHWGAWISAVRTPPLTDLHATLWGDAGHAARGTVYSRYQAETWFPHVTLGDAASMIDALPLLLRAVEQGRLGGEIAIDNLALIEEVAGGHTIALRIALGSA